MSETSVTMIGLRCPTDLATEFRRLAEEEERTVSQELRRRV